VFSARDNALELRARAEKAGFHALVQTVGSGPARRYRVYAEPKLDRAAVQRAAVSVQQKLGIKGYVTRYYP
jgi:cell division septation protein DedD